MFLSEGTKAHLSSLLFTSLSFFSVESISSPFPPPSPQVVHEQRPVAVGAVPEGEQGVLVKNILEAEKALKVWGGLGRSGLCRGWGTV